MDGRHPMSEPVDLTRRRSERRQAARGASANILIVLPHTDGDLAAALADVEEVLLLAELAEDQESLPVALGERRAADAVGRLAASLRRAERPGEDAEPAVQPLAPDGRFELVPLHLLRLSRDELAAIAAGVEALLSSRTTDSHPALDEALSDYAGGRQAAEALLMRAERALALLTTGWDDDADRLAERLEAQADGSTPARVVLTVDEHTAYLRLTDRFLATWASGDPLERFIYRGT